MCNTESARFAVYILYSLTNIAIYTLCSPAPAAASSSSAANKPPLAQRTTSAGTSGSVAVAVAVGGTVVSGDRKRQGKCCMMEFNVFLLCALVCCIVSFESGVPTLLMTPSFRRVFLNQYTKLLSS